MVAELGENAPYCHKKKSRIRVTKHLSTDADSSTAAKKLLSIFFKFLPAAIAADAAKGLLRRKKMRMFPPPPQHVTCHVSRVTCHMSHVTCHVFFVRTKLWSLSVEGLLSTGPTPSSSRNSLITQLRHRLTHFTALHWGLSKYLTAQDTRDTPTTTKHNKTLVRLCYLLSLQPRSTIKS